MAFNEEIVARAIFECNIPIISAVGHEIDFTIADFVADHRAPTPTGAAEMAVPDITDLDKYISQLKIRLVESIRKQVNYQKLYLDSIKNSFVIKNPMIMFDNRRQKLDILVSDINNAMTGYITKERYRLDKLKESYILKNPRLLYDDKKKHLLNIMDKLELVNPLGVLKRGYAVAYMEDRVLNTVSKVKCGDNISVRLQDGLISATVDSVKES